MIFIIVVGVAIKRPQKVVANYLFLWNKHFYGICWYIAQSSCLPHTISWTSNAHRLFLAFFAHLGLLTLPFFHCRELACLHTFHTQCMENWLRKDSTCPTCRADVQRWVYSPLDLICISSFCSLSVALPQCCLVTKSASACKIFSRIPSPMLMQN